MNKNKSNESTNKKPFYKRKWFIALVAFFIIGGALNSANEDKPKDSAENKSSSSSPKKSSSSSKSTSTTPKKSNTEANIPENSTPTELLNQLNAGKLKAGKSYNISVEFFENNTWFATKTYGSPEKHYSVMVKAGNNDDLQLFTSKSKADYWQDGTKADLTVLVKQDKDDDIKVTNLYITKSKIISGGTTPSKKASAASSSSEQKVDNSVSEQKDAINNAVAESGANITVIDSIEKLSSSSYYVHLNVALSSMQSTELKVLIQTINQKLFEAANYVGETNPQFIYKINNLTVAENRSILDPSAVKFKNIN